MDNIGEIKLFEATPKNLFFQGDKIGFEENSVTVQSFAVTEFIKQFEILVFKDDKTHETAIYVRIDWHPDANSIEWDKVHMKRIQKASRMR